ncbi:MAG TPA: LysM peptidoglycan-binding domain-containing protein [Candidatus Paceibacterota bacterium]
MNENDPQNPNEVPAGPSSQNPRNKKLFLWVVVGVVAAVLALGGFLLWQQSRQAVVIEKLSGDQASDISDLSLEGSSIEKSKQCQYGDLPKELYLDTYIVRPGDTLLSIANRELGSTARINEIVNLNKNRGLPYHSLYTSDVIEVGWELYLSAEFLPPNSGDLVAKRGRLRIDDSSPFAGRLLIVSHPDVFPTGTPVSFAENARFFETSNFQAGDCVMIIRDEGTDTDIVMGLQSNPYAFKKPSVVYEKNKVGFPRRTSKCLYDFLGSEKVLRSYTVKAGDTLYSIAEEQVGDGARHNEIREINKKRYESLKDSDFIEIGWELLLPPAWTRMFSGSFSGFAGVLVKEDGDDFWVASDLSDPGLSNFAKTPEMDYFGKDNFLKGDCVVIFNTRGKALGIASQEDDYIRYFKYGE